MPRVTKTPGDVKVVAGVDTHRDTHHVAVLASTGEVLGDAQFPVTKAGYQQVLEWLETFGTIDRVGIELTGSYGAGLTRHLTASGVTVVEVNTSDKATRAKRGKTDQLDAIDAARKVLSGMASAIPKDTTGVVEQIRMLTLVRTGFVKNRTMLINQLKALIVTAPDPLREQVRGIRSKSALRDAITALVIDDRPATEVVTILAWQALVTTIRHYDTQIAGLDSQLLPLVKATAPSLLALPQIGPQAAATFLITAGANITRFQSDAAFARLCGAAPVPVSSGKTNRMRLHRGGDRRANSALHMIIVGRLKNHPPTQAYILRRMTEGLSKKDAIRALKRFTARQVYYALKHDLTTT